jgi:ABC-type dipeptide/oligopeptide/nickel transport system ATPase component
MLFISHDLAVVRQLADRTGVLFRGSLVEIGPTERIFEPPYHPYTEELLLAVPSFRQRRSGAKQVPKSAKWHEGPSRDRVASMRTAVQNTLELFVISRFRHGGPRRRDTQ